MKHKRLPVGAFKVEAGHGTRIRWDYVDRRGVSHGGVVYSLLSAMRAAEVYGFKLNGEGVTA